MFTFLIQFLDLIKGQGVGLFFLFFVVAWGTYGVKLLRRRKYTLPFVFVPHLTTSIIVPVYYEDSDIWLTTLSYLQKFAQQSKIIIVSNGKENGEAEVARGLGFKVLSLPKANKREAVVKAARELKTDITFVLDSDTWLSEGAIAKMLTPFIDPTVGGVTPKQEIFTRHPLFRRISDWMEDLRFYNTVMQQSVGGAVACLPGRILAIRTKLLQKASPEFLNERFLWTRCVTGDDRFLTSWLLKHGHKTIYQSDVTVRTDSPVTFKKFLQQRLRWSRSSFRESLLSIPWIWRYPYTAFSVFMDIFVRWFFFAVIVNAVLLWTVGRVADHYIWHVLPSQGTTTVVVLGTIIGFLISGLFRQVDHLRRYPEDFKYLPVFLIITTFVLTPLEWYGNLTCFKNSWLTKKI